MYDLVLELPHRNTMTLQMDIDGRWWGCGYPATRLYVAMPCAMQLSQRSLQYGRLTIWLRTNAMAIAHRTNGMIKIFQKISLHRGIIGILSENVSGSVKYICWTLLDGIETDVREKQLHIRLSRAFRAVEPILRQLQLPGSYGNIWEQLNEWTSSCVL